ncbi:MAG: hypothetical protein ACKO6N_16695 [Myxococcota bacterium]
MKSVMYRRIKPSNRRKAARLAKNRKSIKRTHGELRKKRNGRLGY